MKAKGSQMERAIQQAGGAEPAPHAVPPKYATAEQMERLIEAMGNIADPEVIGSAVDSWLDEHPEATTTVQDGSITAAKLAPAVAENVAAVPELKSAFNAYLYGLDKQYPVVGDDYYEIPLQLIKGKTYTITNKTTASCTVNVKKTDGTTTSISTQLIVNGSVSFTPSTDEYIGIRGWSNAAGYIQIVCDYSDVEQTVKLSNLNNISIFSGYIASDGSISTPDTTKQEVYTEKIPIDVGYTFDFNLEYAEAKAMWFAYAIYNSAGTFIERITLDAGITQTSHNYSFTISNANAKFVAFTFRSYGIASFAINTPDVTKVLNNKIVALNENFVSIYPLINKNVRSINHRGYNTVAPENTLPAYKLSKRMGFDYAECDISFTSDGVAVLLHDGTINRTARNADGTEVSTSISISSITYEQALQYDFGIWKSDEYAGTKIPTFTQFIQLCKRIGLSAYVELKLTGTTEARVHEIIDIVKNCGMSGFVTWISFDSSLLTYVKDYDSSARIGLVTESVTSDTITTVTGLKTTENEVFIDADVYNDTVVNLCASANIPLEVWTINSAATMQSLNTYITGATSDLLIFGKALYDAYIN